MKLMITFILLLAVSAFGKTEFGEKITLENPVTLDQALKGDLSKEQLIKANVTKVCKMKGCWLMLQGPSEEYRVTFSEYGTTVPMSLIGKTVLVQGKIKKKTLTLKQTKHYIEDEGGDPSKVTEPRTEYRVVATGVKLIQKN